MIQDPALRKLLLTFRRALLMMAAGIAEACGVKASEDKPP